MTRVHVTTTNRQEAAAAATTGTAPHSPRTFVQPVTEAVVNHTFLASGDHADGLLPDVRAVVDIVLKDKYLIGKRKKTHINQGSGYRVFLKAQISHLVSIFLVRLFDRTRVSRSLGAELPPTPPTLRVSLSLSYTRFTQCCHLPQLDN